MLQVINSVKILFQGIQKCVSSCWKKSQFWSPNNLQSKFKSNFKQIINLILQWKVIQENKYNGERLQYLWKSVMNEVSSKWTEYNYVFQQIQIL